MARFVSEDLRRAAAVIALERGCPDAALLLTEGHRFPRCASAMRPVERRAWAALVAARNP